MPNALNFSPGSGGSGWYGLFSRGARDWLRHNEKIRQAVRDQLPQIVSGNEVITGGAATVRVTVRILEHYHFRLREGESEGAGQGAAKPGDVFGQPQPGNEAGDGDHGPGGQEDGGIRLVLEFRVEDIVDWIWEQLQLPDLEPRRGPSEERDYVREGWERRGARSRLDRRRSLREAVKRRAVSGGETPGFIDEDLRFKPLAHRKRPAMHAVVFFALDVSSSMAERERRLAKMFFFWSVQGLRRRYRHIDMVFVAHTTEAWEFNEGDFFNVSGAGGTTSSTAIVKANEIVQQRFSPANSNIYLFYASDGDNATTDREPLRGALRDFAAFANFIGYVEVTSSARSLSETGAVFKQLSDGGNAVASFSMSSPDDVWPAVRHFLTREQQAATA